MSERRADGRKERTGRVVFVLRRTSLVDESLENQRLGISRSENTEVDIKGTHLVS